MWVRGVKRWGQGEQDVRRKGGREGGGREEGGRVGMTEPRGRLQKVSGGEGKGGDWGEDARKE